MTIDRDLTVGQFPRRPRILAGHADRVPPLFFKPGVLKDEDPIAFAGKCLQAGDPLPVEGGLLPDHIGQQMIELLLIGLGHDRGQGVAVLVGMLAEQTGEILAQGLGTRPLGKVHAQWGQKLGQLGKGCARGLGQPLLLVVLDDHSCTLSQIYRL